MKQSLSMHSQLFCYEDGTSRYWAVIIHADIRRAIVACAVAVYYVAVGRQISSLEFGGAFGGSECFSREKGDERCTCVPIARPVGGDIIDVSAFIRFNRVVRRAIVFSPRVPCAFARAPDITTDFQRILLECGPSGRLGAGGVGFRFPLV